MKQIDVGSRAEVVKNALDAIKKFGLVRISDSSVYYVDGKPQLRDNKSDLNEDNIKKI